MYYVYCTIKCLLDVLYFLHCEMPFKPPVWQGGRGSHGSSHKSGASKVSKQLAVAFAKRTLARCQKFEETGQSCFNEPILRDALFSQPVHHNNEKISDGIISGTAPNMHVESHNCQLGSRVSGMPL